MWTINTGTEEIDRYKLKSGMTQAVVAVRSVETCLFTIAVIRHAFVYNARYKHQFHLKTHISNCTLIN